MEARPPSGISGCEAGPDRRPPAPAWQAWLETVGISLALIAIGALVDRRDPFLLRRGFSWLVLPPLFAALQYGSLHGLSCAALQAVLLGIAWRMGIATLPESTAEIVMGWLFTGLVAGEFRDFWSRRVRQAESRADSLKARLEALGREYVTLKISHDRLQCAAPEGAETLRDAVAAFRKEVAQAPGSVALAAMGNRILALFSEHASVRAATLHPLDASGRPTTAVAAIGPEAPGNEHDAVVIKAAQSGQTASLREAGEGQVLAAVPLVDARGRAHGVVAIREMPFLALNSDTLELLAVLGGRLGDCLSEAAFATEEEAA